MSTYHVSSALIEEWKREESQPFIGWDFFYLEGRRVESGPAWSYEGMVNELMMQSSSVLDLGTGGGEKLLEFRQVFPPTVAATEGYLPNLRLARKRLEPLGVKVVESKGSLREQLPFGDDEFDLVIDRHTAFNIAEVERVLKPRGIFLTQQVDGNSQRDLIEAFGGQPQWPFFTLEFMLQLVAATFLTVELAQEWIGQTEFKDVGALVYYLKVVPWLVPDFSVAGYLPLLEKQQLRLETEGALTFQSKLLLLKARKDHYSHKAS